MAVNLYWLRNSKWSSVSQIDHFDIVSVSVCHLATLKHVTEETLNWDVANCLLEEQPLDELAAYFPEGGQDKKEATKTNTPTWIGMADVVA